MSSPQGNDQGQNPGSEQGQGNDQGKPKRKPRVLDVVEYVHHDVILGRDHTGLGVVLQLPTDDGGTAVVRPLASHHVEVDPVNLTVLTAADVTES